MEMIRTWLLGVVAASICLAVFYALIPKGALRTIAYVSGGLVLLLVMLRPLTEWQGESLSLRYDDYRAQVDEQIEVYRSSYQQQLDTGIQQETSAYISEKAAQMGLTCRPEVVTKQENGVPVPWEVTLDIPYNAELAAKIHRELGITESRQHWKETP